MDSHRTYNFDFDFEWRIKNNNFLCHDNYSCYLVTYHKVQKMNAGNGYTQKEMLQLLLDGQNRLHDRIDDLEDKVDKKVGRQELFGWVTAGVVSLTGLMAFFG